MIKPRTPPGTLELLPREQIAFQRMLDVIRRNYERFGFLPVETPVFELSDVLLTKSGGEPSARCISCSPPVRWPTPPNRVTVRCRNGAALRPDRAAGALRGRARA